MIIRSIAINIIFSFSILLICNAVKSQNLLANPGFEEFNICVEYRALCAPEAWFNIPATNILVNSRVAPDPVSGHMLLIFPVGNVMANFNKPRFVYTGFCCPLIAGQKYTLSFFLNTATVNFKQLAFYFTDTEPSSGNVNQLIKTPDLIITPQHIDSNNNQSWKHIKCNYIATGKEKFFIMGTAGIPPVVYDMKDAMNKSGDVLYFIDDIEFRPDSIMPPCNAFNTNKQYLYDQNYRHTNNVLALPEMVEEPKMKPVVHFKNDTITIAALLFDVGKYNIKPYVKNILDSLVAVIDHKNFLKIEVSGHTDNSGNQKSNQTLSEARATAIQQYIIHRLPRFAEKIHAAGKGQDVPIAPNDTESGREKNRRVEIVITYFEIAK